MTYENSWFITLCFFSCIYPILFYVVVRWIANRAKRIDWQNFRLPWRKQ